MGVSVYFYAVWGMAGLITGLTSFGSNLIAVPLLAFVFGARESILIGCISAALIFLALALLYYRSICWRETFYLVIGALAGIPPGAWFLQTAGPAALLIAAGLALCLFLVWQFFASSVAQSYPRIGAWFAWPMGVVSGILMGSVGMGGPPLVLYAYLRRCDKGATIATINAASFGIIACVLPWQYQADLFSPQIIKYGLLGGAAGVIGILASLPLVKRLDISFFRRLLLAMLALSAAALIIRGLFFGG